MEQVFSCKNKNWQDKRDVLLFDYYFFGFKVVDKRTKVVKISDFQILSGWIEKYKPALSGLNSSWDNSYYVRLVIVSLGANVGRLQFLVSKDSFLC